jgi:hypothetical protein
MGGHEGRNKMRGKSLSGTVAALAATAVFLGACVGTGVDTYEEFESAIEGGAPCNQLFDMRENFDKAKDLERIDADLDRLGCDDRNSDRNDQ